MNLPRSILENLKKEEEYWLNKLSGDVCFTPIPYDLGSIHRESTGEQKNSFHFTFPVETRRFITKLSKGSDLAAYMIMISAIHVLIHRYSGEEDIISAIPVMEQEDTKDYINNLLVLRNNVDTDKTFKELLLQVRQDVVDSIRNQNYPLDSLAQSLDLYGDVEHQFIPVLTIFEGLDMESMLKDIQFNLAFHLSKTDGELKAIIKYRPTLFSERFIERLANNLKQILLFLQQNKDCTIGEMEIMSGNERQLLTIFNSQKQPLPNHNSLLELFKRQVQDAPNQVALRFKYEKITYQELNKLSNQVARNLLEYGIRPHKRVGILSNTSIEMIAGLLGVMKAGGTFVPIDPNYPKERITYIIKDSKMEFLLLDPTVIVDISFEGTLIHLDDQELYHGDATDIELTILPDQLAYIIYTSGSTGTPKGVMVQHKSILSSLYWRRLEYDFNSSDCSLQLFSFAFDGFITSFFTPLLSGSQIVLLPNAALKDIMELKESLIIHKVTHFITTPSFYARLIEILEASEIPHLRVVALAGEPLHEELVRKSVKKIPHLEIVNEYGPTENSVVTTIARNIQLAEKISIGSSLPHSNIYIMNNQMRLQPLGVIGEICISGDGLATGYLNNEELTREKFIKHPNFPEERIYKTGDLGRWLPDGTIEFIGRLDNQVKIRGFRIELNEIEKVLLKYSCVQKAVVIDRVDKEGSKYLCAYIVSSTPIDISNLKDYLKTTLPEYMIPTSFLEIDEIPLTITGKLNIKALPEPKIHSSSTNSEPKTELQARLIALWEDILDIPEGQLSIRDNLFSLGAHSLKIASFIAKAYKEINVVIPIHEIFARPTLLELSQFIQGDEKVEFISIERAPIQSYYPLSSSQRRMFILNNFRGKNVSYNMPGAVLIKGKLNRGRLEGALKALVSRHESLRTCFVSVDGQLHQKILPEITLPITYSEASGVAVTNIVSDFVKPFDLATAPLFRMKLIRTSDDSHIMLIDMHHIISDGISVQILIEEFGQLYDGLALPELSIQYKDYATWQSKFLDSEEMKKQEKYWLGQFENEPTVLQIDTDYQRPLIKDHAGDVISFSIEADVAEGLGHIAKSQGATLFMVLLAAYNILLHRYSGQEDIVVGSPISGRRHEDLKGIIGMFVNTLAFRSYPMGEKSFTSFLVELKETVLNGLENQDYPLENIIDKLNSRRDLSRNPLFDTMFALQNMDRAKLTLSDLTLERFETEKNISKFDISLFGKEDNDEIRFDLEYSTRLFNRESMERFGRHFVQICKFLTQQPDCIISEIELLDKEDYNRIQKVNDTKLVVGNKVIHHIFEEQASKTPHHIAVTFREQILTYEDLNRKSNQLARVLINKGVQSEDLVGVMLNRSVEMLISIFAILKAGGAYVPIDPAFPSERINYILKDTGTNLLLVNGDVNKEITFPGEIILLENEHLYKGDSSNLTRKVSASNLAYVIYTSGSTGNPKGVMVEHQNVTNILYALQKAYPVTGKEAYLLKTTFTFDVSVTELFGWFFGGGRVVVLEPGAEREPDRMALEIQRNGVTHVNFVPSMLRATLQMLKQEKLALFSTLKYLFVAGEAIEYSLVEDVFSKLPHVSLENLYGPTEASIYATKYAIKQSDRRANVPIGMPVQNVQIYILDQYGNHCPVGVSGEIFIAGDGVTKGYLNQDKLTSSVFLPNPFEPGTRMYKTGDMGKWRADGNVEYLGRRDHQVKIRGYRIELFEIEEKLLRHENIKEATVVDFHDEQDTKYLCAYIVAKREISLRKLRGYLSKKLPDYMVPTYFVIMDRMPLISSGKLDKKALPKPQANFQKSLNYVPPRSETETQLAELWSEVLEIPLEKIGIYDSFFDLGGNSLTILKLLSKAYSHQMNLTIQDMYMYQDISKLAQKISEERNEQEQIVPNFDIIERKNSLENMIMPELDLAAYSSILLTGATGFLGSHLLYELLKKTDTVIYCLVRGSTVRESYQRLQDTMGYYFSKDTDVQTQLKKRVIIVNGDISEERFGLELSLYETLQLNIDAIIHAASLVKHYGHFDEFYQVNVKGTQEVIDFSQLSHVPIHYISTLSVAGKALNENKRLNFTESDFYIGQNYSDNVYVSTKFMAENLLFESMNSGLPVSIYRIGNLTGRLSDGQFQMNISENAFYNRLKTVLEAGVIPESMMNSLLEFTPVDVCSEAILRIFQTTGSRGRVFHLFNHNLYRVQDLQSSLESLGVSLEMIDDSSMMKLITEKENNSDYYSALISMGNQNAQTKTVETPIGIDSEYTIGYLSELGFKWPKIESTYLKKVIRYTRDVSYINISLEGSIASNRGGK